MLEKVSHSLIFSKKFGIGVLIQEDNTAIEAAMILMHEVVSLLLAETLAIWEVVQ